MDASPAADSEEANQANELNPNWELDPMNQMEHNSSTSEPPAPTAYISRPDRDEYFDVNDPINQPWFTHEEPPKPSARPSYEKMCVAMKERAIACMVMAAQEPF